MLKIYLKNLVEINDNISSKIFDITIQIVIILSILAFSIETIPDLQQSTRDDLNIFEIFSVAIFTIEYIIRIYTAEKRWSYIFSFYGLIDLLSILPFYLAFFIDLRSLKAFKLFRLFRLFKLTKYNKTLDKFQKAIANAKEEFILFLVLTLIMFYLSSVGIYYFEHEAQPKVFSSIFDSMWWAVATLTTVGYGDVYPVTVGGKIFTTFMLLVGLGIVGIPAGIVAAALTEVNKSQREERKNENF
jgi:voltage-gated potassium channel